MSDLLESLRQSFADPVTRHAMLVHFPIAVSLLAIPFVVVLPFLGSRKATAYRVVLALILFLIAVVAWQASEAGETARTVVEARLPGQHARDVLARHATIGERIPLLMAVTAVLVGSTAIRIRWVRLGCGVLAICAAVTTAAVVVIASDDGGRLVHHLDRTPGGWNQN
jgi:uncharacterized membrane protein